MGIASGLTSGIASSIVSSMTDDDKVRENRLRRMAVRQGLILQKSRLRDSRAIGYGTYQLASAATNAVEVAGSPAGYGLSLDEVEKALTRDR